MNAGDVQQQAQYECSGLSDCISDSCETSPQEDEKETCTEIAAIFDHTAWKAPTCLNTFLMDAWAYGVAISNRDILHGFVLGTTCGVALALLPWTWWFDLHTSQVQQVNTLDLLSLTAEVKKLRDTVSSALIPRQSAILDAGFTNVLFAASVILNITFLVSLCGAIAICAYRCCWTTPERKNKHESIPAEDEIHRLKTRIQNLETIVQEGEGRSTRNACLQRMATSEFRSSIPCEAAARKTEIKPAGADSVMQQCSAMMEHPVCSHPSLMIEAKRTLLKHTALVEGHDELSCMQQQQQSIEASLGLDTDGKLPRVPRVSREPRLELSVMHVLQGREVATYRVEWDLSGAHFLDFRWGECLDSPEFSVASLAGLRLRFIPRGGPADGRCRLAVVAPGNAALHCRLFVEGHKEEGLSVESGTARYCWAHFPVNVKHRYSIVGADFRDGSTKHSE